VLVKEPRKDGAPTADEGALLGELPFTPFSATLRDVLRRKYIKKVALWLLGKDENSVLAQQGNSVWEAALTIIFLADATDIFAELGEEPELRDVIRYKSTVVARWLLSKRIVIDGTEHVCWERVTWDTSVVIRALLTSLKKYHDSFSEAEQKEITEAILRATKWLYYRFSQWETQVKYPFGPADVAQIVITILYLAREYPGLYDRILKEYYGDQPQDDWAAEIVEYLLHKKTEKTQTIEISREERKEVLAYYWDDYFSTAEVIEALGLFHQHCHAFPTLLDRHKRMLYATKEALIRACTYCEQEQVDGMWGSHIDTIKVVYSYVKIRRLIPQRTIGLDDPLIVPEIHTTFKALRWMCDEKQIFSDGSFLHTMFLTIFYALALVEIYRSWPPAADRVEKIYDDVVWFSPVRTTPERSKRLAAELRNAELQEELDAARGESGWRLEQIKLMRRNYGKLIISAVLSFVAALLFPLLGNRSGVFRISFEMLRLSDFFQYVAVFIPVFVALVTLIWQYDKWFGERVN